MKRCWLLFAFLLLPACVSDSDFGRLRNDVYELQKKTHEDRKEIDSLKERMSGVAKEDSFTAVRESQADLVSKVNETSRGLQELRGRFDENRYFMEKSLRDGMGEKDLLKTQIAALETQVRKLKDRVAVLEGHGEPQEAANAVEPAEAARTEPVPHETKAEPAADSRKKAYDAAYQLFQEKKYKESREKFEAFIKEYPKSDLSDNAQFWIAETYYAEKDFESAILSYETVIKKYPDSRKTNNALLKQGYAFAEIGDAKTCKIILNKLIDKYPDSREAELAKKKIAELDKKPAKKR